MRTLLMAQTKKSRSVKKWPKEHAEISPEKGVGASDKCQTQKRKLSDMLGSQWSKDELEHFYKAYRKYGKDWNKVAGVVHNRTSEMVEALYNMNRAYLSLPDGTASVAGLIAMMTDHYHVQEGSGCDRESNDLPKVHSKLKKRRQSGLEGDVLQSLHVPPNDNGCLSLLRQRSYGCTVRKRTPRVPVSYSPSKDSSNNISSKQGLKTETDKNVTLDAAFALTEASKSGGSQLISPSPYRNSRTKFSPPKIQEKMPELLCSKLRGINARHGSNSMDDQSGYVVGVYQKRGKINRKSEKIENIRTDRFDDSLEACNGTGEGLSVRGVGGKRDTEVMKENSERSSLGKRKRNKKLFFGGDSSELEDLQMLADLSLLLPESNVESEFSIALNEDSPTVLQAGSTSHQGSKSNLLRSRENVLHTVSGIDNCKSDNNELERESKAVFKDFLSEGKQQAQSISKSRKMELNSSSLKNFEVLDHASFSVNKPMNTEAIIEEEKNLVNEFKCASQDFSPSKQSKSVEDGQFSSSNCDMINEGPAKPRRRKMNPKILENWNDMKLHKFISKDRLNKLSTFQNGSIPLKDKVSCCLSSYMVHKWCTFEWFYSSIDHPWFAKKEFIEYLNHVRLGHIPRLTRVEWGVIKSSLGKPRRFSENFLNKEREKLKQYRESVRKHFSELRSGIKEGLPTDLARPLSVGQRVVAIHPKSRAVYDGSVLTVGHDKCRIQFDRPELGVEIVMDIDCMSSDPMDNIPDAIRRHNAFDSYFANSRGLRPGRSAVGRPVERSPKELMGNVKSSNGTLLRQGKVSSALLNMGQHNTCTVNALPPWVKSPANLCGSVVPIKSLDTSVKNQDSGCRLVGIVNDSKLEAQAMVNTAVQAMSKLKLGQNALANVREALYSSDRSITLSSELDNGGLAYNQMKSKLDLSLNCHTYDPNVRQESDGLEAHIPTELITSCVATYLMLQMCAERQCQPADVAQILDSALTSLYPRCSQNLPIYKEIEMYMGRVKSQILAVVPHEI